MRWSELRAALVCRHDFDMSFDSYSRVMTYDCRRCPLAYDSTMVWSEVQRAWVECLVDRWLAS